MECGGLHILGSERHESRRIDRQLRGRAGRQGDPGASQFFLSLEDDLMRLFGSERIARLMDRMGAQEGEVLTHPLITRSIETAQKRVELQNFQSRKRLLEYDDVMNQQREVVYSLRTFALEGGEELKGEALEDGREGGRAAHRDAARRRRRVSAMPTIRLLGQELLQRYLLLVPSFEDEGESADDRSRRASRVGADAARAAFTGEDREPQRVGRAAEGGPRDMARAVLAHVMLGVLDEKWKDHLYDLDQLRNSINYRAWGQKDPLDRVQAARPTRCSWTSCTTSTPRSPSGSCGRKSCSSAPRPAGAPGGPSGSGQRGRSATGRPASRRKRYNALGMLEDIGRRRERARVR